MKMLRRLSLMLAATTLMAGALLLGPFAYTARASLTYCQSDPVVTLSNGVRITVYENIYDASTDVSTITYQLHIPVSLTVTAISYSGAVPATQQRITTYADENPGNYDSYTVVYTHTANISVTAYLSANSTVSAQTAGHGGQLLHNHDHLG